MGVQVSDLPGIDFPIRQCKFHNAADRVAFFGWCGEVMSFRISSVPDQLGENRNAPPQSCLSRLENKNAGALADYKSITLDVPRARRKLRLGIAR